MAHIDKFRTEIYWVVKLWSHSIGVDEGHSRRQ